VIEIKVEANQGASVVRLVGEIDAVAAVAVQQSVLPLAVPGCKLVLDMSSVAYMSSAGLRMLLSVYRSASARQGRIVLMGLSEELKDTMSMTGFLGYFSLADTLEGAVQSLK